MARFSPRDPGFTVAPTLAGGLGQLAQSAGAAEEELRLREIEEEELERRREAGEVDLFERGFTREPRMERVPPAEDVLTGQPGMGLQRTEAEPPDIFRGARPGLSEGAPGGVPTEQELGVRMPGRPPGLAEGLGQMAEERGPIQTQDSEDILAIPGAFVEGMGFTPRVLRSTDLVQANRQRAVERAGPRERLAPGVEQVDEDLFFDESRTPEGREAVRESARGRERRSRLEAVLGAIQSGRDLSPDQLAEGIELGLDEDRLFGKEGGGGPTLRVGGRDFPDSPEGRTAALAWQESLAEARRSGSGERITGETTRRTLATAAARAIDQIQSDVRELTPFERQNLEPGQVQRQIQSVLSLFGFESVPELQEEMRTLRLGPGGGGAPPRSSADGGGGDGGDGGDGGGFEVSDEVIDRIISENPDATEEELMDLIIAAQEGGS